MAKIPTILKAGRADGKLVISDAIFDENKSMFQSEINDIQDTLTSDNSNKPLSANQGKILKELLDAKVIEAGAVPIDAEPTKDNTIHVVNSDGIYKALEKKVNTVTFEERNKNQDEKLSKLEGKVDNPIIRVSRITDVPNIVQASHKIVFNNNAAVIYKNKFYPIDSELDYYDDPASSALRVLVFNISTYKLYFIPYTAFKLDVEIALGTLNCTATKLESANLPFNYKIDGVNIDTKLDDLKQEQSDNDKKLSAITKTTANVFTKNTVVRGYIAGVSPNTTDYRWLCDYRYIPVHEGEAYTLYGETLYNIGIACYNNNQEFVKTLDWNTAVETIIIPEGIKYIRLSFSNQAELNIEDFNFIELRKVVDNPLVNFVLTAKDFVSGYLAVNASRTIVSNTEWICCKTYFSVTAGSIYNIVNSKQYIVGVIYYDKNYKYVSNIGFGTNVLANITIPDNVYYARFNFRVVGGLTPDTFDYVNINNTNNSILFVRNKDSKYAVVNVTNNGVFQFPAGYSVVYNNIDYPLADGYAAASLPFSIAGSSFKFLVFDIKTHKLKVTDYNKVNNQTDIAVGWFMWSASAVQNYSLPFDITNNGVLYKESLSDIPILKYSNDTSNIPNFNTSTNKLEFPNLALVQYGKTSYPLEASYGASSFDIPTTGSSLKAIVFNKRIHILSIKPVNLIDINVDYPLGWFIYPLGSHQLPFPFTVNGKKLGDATDITLDGDYRDYLDVIKYQGHFFMSYINTSTSKDPIYPSQSIADIQFCSRVGVKAIEANCLKTATPGKYIVMHGDNGCVGYQMLLKKEAYNANPSAYPYAVYDEAHDAYFNFNPNAAKDALNGHIPSTPYEDLRNNYFNRSIYPKFRTPITDLEDFLYECKKQDVFPIVTYQDEAQIPVIENIMGKNYAFRSGVRHGNVLHIQWSTETNKDKVLNICRTVGRPFIYGMGTEAACNMSDADLKDLINAVHAEGYYIIFDGNYYSESMNQKLKKYAFDGKLTGWDVPYFESGNICNLYSDITFDDFNHNGTVSNGSLLLNNNNTITPKANLPSMFLSKAYLEIRYKGTIKISMGSDISSNVEYNSDGVNTMIFSSVFLGENKTPTFTITSVGTTEVLDISYKVSRC